MTDPIHIHALRKQRLLIRSGQLRRAIAQDVAALSPVLTLADGAIQFGSWVGRHRVAAAASVLLALLIRPKAGLRWLRRGVLAWGICRRAGAAWQSALALWRQRQA